VGYSELNTGALRICGGFWDAPSDRCCSIRVSLLRYFYGYQITESLRVRFLSALYAATVKVTVRSSYEVRPIRRAHRHLGNLNCAILYEFRNQCVATVLHVSPMRDGQPKYTVDVGASALPRLEKLAEDEKARETMLHLGMNEARRRAMEICSNLAWSSGGSCTPMQSACDRPQQ
jgi:hypothetical protein